MTDDRLDACLRLVSDKHRRVVIHHLRSEAAGESTLDDLTDRLHSSERALGSGRCPDRDQLAIKLTHTHLPKLAEYGVVEYDLRSGAVRYQPDDRVESVLDSLPEEVAPPNP